MIALLLGMNDVSFDTDCDWRFAMERSCARLVAKRRTETHLDAMSRELGVEQRADLTDEAFCASDVVFYRAFVNGAGNTVLVYQMAGSIAATQPLMCMITFTSRSRIVGWHSANLGAATGREAARLEDYKRKLAHSVFVAQRIARSARRSVTSAAGPRHAPFPLPHYDGAAK